MDGAVGDNNGFADVKKLMNTYEKGGGYVEPSQARYVGGGGRDAGQGMNTDYVSVDQGRVVTWRVEGAGGFGRGDDVGGSDPGPVVGEGGSVCGGGGCVEHSQAIYVGGGGRDAGHGMNTDYVSVDQRRAATWREEGGGHGPGLAVGEGSLNEAEGGEGVDGVGGHDIDTGRVDRAGGGQIDHQTSTDVQKYGNQWPDQFQYIHQLI